NQDGMRWRLRKAAGLKVLSVKQGIRLAKDLFGGEIEDRIETISGKNIIGLFEDISLFGENGNEIKTKAKIDTGADTTSIDKRLASKLGFEEIVEAFSDEEKKNISDEKFGEEMLKNLKEKFIEKFEKLEDVQLVRSSHGFSIRPVVNIKIKLGDTILDTRANIFNREHLTYKVIVGRKSLSRFLIEPSKLKNE
ncbi:MAG TPA: RimK/LysX family protein, partial [Candidatus Dojkabacteria bacterium]